MDVTVLDRILDETRREVARRRQTDPLEELERRARSTPRPQPFAERLECGEEGTFRVIAEIKKASPSKGLIRADFDPVAIARSYAAGGCAAISVLTDEPFFQGSLEYLRGVRAAVDVPLLRKDFVVDPYQVWESRAAGADAILLIVAALDDDSLRALNDLAVELELDVLVEVHDRVELERAARLEPRLIGINNRNLRTFDVRLETTRELAPHRPTDCLLVSESGFSTRAELERLRQWGVDAFLIGESLMRAADPGQALAELCGPASGRRGHGGDVAGDKP